MGVEKSHLNDNREAIIKRTVPIMKGERADVDICI